MNGARAEAEAVFAPNPWIRITADGQVVLMMGRSEMGQGAMGGFVILAAEELRLPPNRIAVQFAPAGEQYVNPLLGAQVTGGSTSIRAAWQPLREAAAQAREALVLAAADLWRVPAGELQTVNGNVVHEKRGLHADYAELSRVAARRPVPAPPGLTPTDKHKWIGRWVPPPLVAEKIRGAVLFGADIRQPGMLNAVVARCPVPGGRPVRFDATRAKDVSGVRQVVPLEQGIAVLADSIQAAKEGREQLEIEWEMGQLRQLNSRDIENALHRAESRRGRTVRRTGNVERAMASTQHRLQAVYYTPYLAHAPLETMNCTVSLSPDGCEIWVPTQNQSAVLDVAGELTGLPHERIQVHTTFLGGGFGRRLEEDYAVEAIQIARKARGVVHLVWSLDDDLTHDFYRPANLNLLQGALDDAGAPIAWYQRTVGPSLALGNVSVPYAIENLQNDIIEVDPGLPTGAWRSVGASQNAFAVESFIDELAHAGGHDPFLFRRELLCEAPRHRRVLQEAAEASGWGIPLPAGWGRGIAVYHSYGGWVAQVVEASVDTEKRIKVHRVVCAVDCGTAVDPAGIEAQMEGAIAFGLSAALKEQITVKDGCVQERDFRAYPLLRFSEMPEVQVHIIESREPPGGVGEPGVPPIAPALANALFAATGKRVRRLPLQTNYGLQA